MRFAETDTGMDVKRVEHHRIGAPRRGYLFGGGMRERIGAADHKTFERQAGVERGAAERLMHTWVADRHRPTAAIAIAVGAIIAGCDFGFELGHNCGAHHRRAHDQFDAADFGVFALPTSQHTFGIVRLDPALEKPGRHRQANGAILDPLQVDAGKPARIDVVADLGAQSPPYPRPAVVIRVRHFLLLYPIELLIELGGWLGSGIPPTRLNGMQLGSVEDVGEAVGPRRLTAGGATTTWSREKLRVHPMGGGAVPRIPVVNVDGMRNAIREGGTMHESKVERRADQTAVRIFALSANILTAVW